MINKISTYVGFAKKSKQIVIGTDNILTNKKILLVLVSDDLSDNAKKKIDSKFKVFVIKNDDFMTAVGLCGVKAIGITDENLAKAIKNLLEVQ